MLAAQNFPPKGAPKPSKEDLAAFASAGAPGSAAQGAVVAAWYAEHGEPLWAAQVYLDAAEKGGAEKGGAYKALALACDPDALTGHLYLARNAALKAKAAQQPGDPPYAWMWAPCPCALCV